MSIVRIASVCCMPRAKARFMKDEYMREGLAVEVEHSLPATRVEGIVESLILDRGAHEYVRSGNGPELIAVKYVQQLSHSLTPGQPIKTSDHREMAADGKVCWTSWIDRGIFDEEGILKELQSTAAGYHRGNAGEAGAPNQ